MHLIAWKYLSIIGKQQRDGKDVLPLDGLHLTVVFLNGIAHIFQTDPIMPCLGRPAWRVCSLSGVGHLYDTEILDLFSL